MDNAFNKKAETGLDRRSLLKNGLALAGGSLLASVTGAQEIGQQHNKVVSGKEKNLMSRRKLGGTLEVSSVGIGVQNMPRTYQTTIPTRSEMINIIRKAYERGVTLFDTAEAYGPFESERILGEAVESFRNKIVIETKYGWNIDQKTGQPWHSLIW